MCEGYHLGEDDLIFYKARLYIPNGADLKMQVMDEINQIPYSRHLGYQKTTTTRRNQYFWHRTKKDIA